MTSSPTTMFEKLKQGFRKFEDSHGDEKSPQDEILPFALTYLTPDMMEEARTQLNETDEGRQKALDDLRRLIDAEENLITPTDDNFLLAFLRSRKFDVKKAFKLLQNFWLFRKEYHYIYDGSDKQTVSNVVLKSYVGLLRFRDRDGSSVFVFRMGLWNPEEDSYDDLFRTISGILVYTLQFPATHIAGFRMIFDMRGLTWTQLKYCTPGNIMILIRSTQFCFPGRYKGLHVLSDNKMFRFFSAIVYPLLTAKLKKRIKFHGENLEPIREYIHPSVLPKEFGGDAPQFDNSEWADILENICNKVQGMLDYGYKN